MNKEKELIKDLRNQIEKDAGEKCKDFNINCIVCKVYLALEILEDFYEYNFNDLEHKLKKEKQKFSPRQKEVLKIISESIEKTGKSPTLPEIQKILKVKSLRSVTQILESLEKKGLIDREYYGRRGVKLINKNI